ncbi:hypothetical protein OHA70_34245 [Kribbella sp. NBC_00382]|uniref:hypothetical protein n=1 Tax=Kribbella sp. NBC_00382 TaxID=2975967 RepID=UPI002E229662
MSDNLLRLYPAGYRDAHGREILDVHREMTMDLPLAARLRADADLIAHALRVRLGLDSASPGGRFFALTTPIALAVAAAYGGIQLMRWYAGVAISPGSTWSHVATTDAPQALNLLLLTLIPLGAILTLTHRWPPGRILTTAGLLGYALQWTASPNLYANGPIEPIAAALTAATLLACPPDLAGSALNWPTHSGSITGRRLAALAGAMAAVAWFPIALVQTRAFVVSTDYGAWPVLVLGATGVVLAFQARPSSLRALAATAVASPLFLAHAYTSGFWQ